MSKTRVRSLGIAASVVLMGTALGAGILSGASSVPPPQDPINGQQFSDDAGTFSTISTAGSVDLQNPFFKSLGTNGRACVNCHQPKVGWTIRPDSAQAVFDATNGLDPLFRTVDGANSPEANVSTVQARREAYSMLLTKGVIRVHMPIPENAEFSLQSVEDPYGHASAADLSLFRRPLPTTNLSFLSTVMWDGRQTVSGQSIPQDLIAQAEDAIQKHEQAMTGQTLPAAALQAIVRFELGLFTAQVSDASAGPLDANGAHGGPAFLTTQTFFPGINDPAGLNPTGALFNPHAFQLYSAWAAQSPGPPPSKPSPPPPVKLGPPPPVLGAPPSGHPGIPPPPPGGRTLRGRLSGAGNVAAATLAARASVARGEQIFNTKLIRISGVAGLNDVTGRPIIPGTCTTCHDSPNAGTHSVPALLNIGIADGVRRTPDMPLYTLMNKATGKMLQTTDPGQALITGKWNDVGKFKVPDLRALETRSPYFHNGFTDDLNGVVDFYDTRFGIGFTPQEKADLATFLRTM